MIKTEKSTKLWTGFLEATRQVCDDLDVDHKMIHAERYETANVGVSYTADGNKKNVKFNFWLKTETEKKDATTGKMTASLEIFYDEGSAPFYFYEDITQLQDHDNFLSRWAVWAVFNFSIRHRPVHLESLFNEMSIRVYGFPRSPFPTMEELHLLLGGVEKYQKQKVLVYRFRHVDPTDKYRSFSYAFLVSHTELHNYWAFFPEIGGLDSGGANHDLQTTEKLIQNLKKVERKYLDIPYEELEKFLQKNAIGFQLENELYDVQFSFTEPSVNAFGKEFAEFYLKFRERYETKDYPGALRDLRAVVQDAMEITCEKKNVAVSH